MATAQQVIPLSISIAPFPEGFQGDLDETFQQACILMEAFIQGNFLTGLVLPPGSTLPTSDQGPIAMGGQWYFFDPVSGQYQPQTGLKAAKNFAKNCIYQIQQTGSTFAPAATGIFNTYDMTIYRTSAATVASIAADVGPTASADTDLIGSAIKYTVGPSLLPTPAAADLVAHEHVFEGSDIAMLQGIPLSLSFSAWANQVGTYSAYLTSPGRDQSYVVNFSIPAASTWYRVKIPNIPALPTGTGTWHFGEGQTGLYFGVPLAMGSQWRTTNLGSWQPAFVAGTASNINLLTVVNNQLKLTGLKLEASASVSYMSVPSFETDFHDATRYYWTNFNYQSLTGGMPMLLVASGTNNAYGSLIFPRRMCKIPTVVPYGTTSHAAGNVTNLSTSTDIAVATLPAVQKGTGGAVTATGAKGDVYGAYLTADARLS